MLRHCEPPKCDQGCKRKLKLMGDDSATMCHLCVLLFGIVPTVPVKASCSERKTPSQAIRELFACFSSGMLQQTPKVSTSTMSMVPMNS